MQRTCESMKKIQYQLCLGMLGLCLVGPALAQEKKDTAGAPIRRERSMRTSITAKVTAINAENREITLKGPEGGEETIMVDKAVRRFDEIKVGDNVKADYYISLAGEVREPTAEEKETPLSEVVVEGKAPAGTDPAAAGMRVIKAVTKVDHLDPATKMIAVKGPRGRTFHIAIKDPATFEKLKEGDSIVITFTEALAISLEKQPPKE